MIRNFVDSWRTFDSGRVFAILVAVLIFAGCGTARTFVMEPVSTKINANTVEIVEGKSTVDVPKEVTDKFHQQLEQILYDKEKFGRGSELKITYRFIQYNKGNQFTRWMWGGIGNSGEGTLTIEAVYSDVTDKQLAKIQSEGKIGSGAFGGEFDLAINKAANAIAEYTVNNFK